MGINHAVSFVGSLPQSVFRYMNEFVLKADELGEGLTMTHLT